MEDMVRRLQSTRQLNLDEMEFDENMDGFDNQDVGGDAPVQSSVNKELKPTD